MKICIVYHGGEFRPLERIWKTAKTLEAGGHEIFLLCNNYGESKKNEESFGSLRVFRLRPTFGSKQLNKIIKFPIFLNPIWIAQLIAIVKRHKIDALQVIDIPLSVAALYVGRMFGIPVIMDMWENYPEALRLWGKTNWKTRIFKNYRVARAVELFATRRLDHIITVVDEQKERLIEDGVDANRVSVITNGFDPKMFLATPPEKNLTLDAGTYNLLYVGAVTPERGLADIVRALKLVLPEVPQARLIIAGDGPEENRLKHIAQEEGVSANVKFLGWVPFQDIQLYVKQSDLCLVPHVYNEFINTTIPNKIFQYMAMSKPVLVSQAKPLARIVRECDCGFVFQSGDPKDAAAKVLDAYRRRDDVTIGARGRSQVMQKYTWDHCAQELLRIYAGLSRMSALEAAL